MIAPNGAPRIAREAREGLSESKVAHLEMDEATVSAIRTADLLAVTRPTIYTWQVRGRNGRVEIGSKRMVPPADVEDLKYSAERRPMHGTGRRVSLSEAEEPLTEVEVRAFTESRAGGARGACPTPCRSHRLAWRCSR